MPLTEYMGTFAFLIVMVVFQGSLVIIAIYILEHYTEMLKRLFGWWDDDEDN